MLSESRAGLGRGGSGRGEAMAELVRVRRLTDREGRRLQQIVRRGSTDSVRYRRAMMPPASAGGNRVPVIARLVAADEDTMRGVPTSSPPSDENAPESAARRACAGKDAPAPSRHDPQPGEPMWSEH
jgi:hypothetical protein